MSPSTHPPVICALSGGVDSAVAALRLLRAGHAVEGLHMTNWEDDDGYCTAARDLQDARTVCRELGIPLHHVNFAAEYRAQVFEYFLAEYAAGRTPNPDVLCNREIKFGAFLAHARRLGAERIATGHYARLDHAPVTRLLKGRDAGKDQSYFLHAVSRDALARSEFPIGELAKADVRSMANEAGLPVFDKPDSTGICFIGERPFREFLARFLPAQPGPMATPDGEIVGEHQGLMYYTLGQRQGLGIGGAGEPWYVVGKDVATNTLCVAQGREHPALYASALLTGPVAWIGAVPGELAGDGELRCAVKTRYRQADAPCRVRRDGPGVRVHFETPQWAVTPGQYAVFYRDDECLGGAPIAETRAASAADAEKVARTA